MAPPTGPKRLVSIDLSGPLPGNIMMIPSRNEEIGGYNYTIQHSRRHTHIIGHISDRGQFLVPGDPTAVSRYLYVLTTSDGSKVVRVMTRTRVSNVFYLRRIQEFIKKVDDAMYHVLVREPIVMNVLEQTEDQNIEIELIPDNPIEEGDLDPSRPIPTYYRIKPAMKFYRTIGVVKYGRHTVDDKIEGLIERRVIWGGAIGNPKITVTSNYTNGTEVVEKYEFLKNEQMFHAFSYKKRYSSLCG
ncbi:hypothetical protein BEWA_046350 [Theileria equi strain WA]|uniref:Uncharacterized protein n=1 Tax=Theileria equi strain WA TaxID=1537102 RepID=L1L9J7_THEEQ|nr:hypothetical protein BEWA_046350 [Theileria equi strain WA]EKX72171.1 hypothetical protein BEWA_046350 [Theileria equi strain WA]|eukprot:XP_004831623.1 hypothetical protein BEWA_046350 [Theileria equi strain WA]